MFLAGRGSQIRHTQALLKSVGEGLGEGSHPGLRAHAFRPLPGGRIIAQMD